jgi:hypothetical protein
MSPHLVWWQLVLIVGFAICAASLAIGAISTFISLTRSKEDSAESVGQRKPAWQRLQWCNAERERLEGEVNKWKRLSESATRFVCVNIISLKVDEKTVSRGKRLTIRYEIVSSEDVSDNIWLGASFPDPKRGRPVYDTSQDKLISLFKGRHEYDRDLTMPPDVSLGNHMLRANVWHGVVGDSTHSVAIANGGAVEIVVVA